jgi:hypothetical protein
MPSEEKLIQYNGFLPYGRYFKSADKSGRVGCQKCLIFRKNHRSVIERGWKFQFGVANPDRDDMSVENKTKAIENPVGMTCRFSFKLLKIFRYRHVIPTGFCWRRGRVFCRYFIPTGFLIAEFERKIFLTALNFLHPHPQGRRLTVCNTGYTLYFVNLLIINYVNL